MKTKIFTGLAFIAAAGEAYAMYCTALLKGHISVGNVFLMFCFLIYGLNGLKSILDPNYFTKYPIESVKFHAVSIKKFIVLYLCTLTLYQFYWLYKNWKAVRLQTTCNFSPALRTFFLFFFSFELFKRILGSATKNGYSKQLSPDLLAWSYILLVCIAPDLPGNWMLITCFSFVPLLFVQKAINSNNLVLDPENIPTNKYSTKELIVVIVGGIFLLLAIIGMFIPGK